MAKNRSDESAPPPRALSRKHISRAEREARQRQRVVIGSAIVALLVIGILVAGVVYSAVVEPNQTMAVVEDETITRREFFKRVNYERFRLNEIIERTRADAVTALSDPTTAEFFGQLYQQQLQQLGSFYQQIDFGTLERMIEERLLVAEAERRGITVSESEIDEEIRRQIGQGIGARLESDVVATAEAFAAATVTAESFTPTPTAEPTATLEPSAVLTETEALTPTATPGPTFTPAPTVTPYILTEDLFEKEYATFLASLERLTGFTEAEFRDVIRTGLVIEKLREEIEAEAEVETTEEQINAAHILISVPEEATDEEREAAREEAEGLLEELRNGADFEALARDNSDDSSSASGGDLGWFGRGRMVPPFEEAAFALESPGDISEVVESQFGFHIIKLLDGPEEREISEAEVDQARSLAFEEFLQQVKEEAEVDRRWDLVSLPDDPFREQLESPLPVQPQGN